MRFRRGFAISIVAAGAAAVAAPLVGTAQGAPTPSRLSVVVHRKATEYLTAAGSSSVFPGRLQTGDRILGSDALLQGNRTVGYDNELCTVTFDNNDLCQVIAVIPGHGQLELNWLWINRNASLNGPSHFTGIIAGGTGTFAHTKGQFTATLLPDGAPKITVTLQ